MSRNKTPAEKLAAVKQRKRPRRNASRIVRKHPLVCHVRAVRESLNLSMRDVALAIKMSIAGLHAIEHGGDVQMTTACKIAAFFGKTIDELWEVK